MDEPNSEAVQRKQKLAESYQQLIISSMANANCFEQ